MKSSVRGYNVGASDYSKHKFQAWDFWLIFGTALNPFDADIVKRILRKKSTDSRMLDYKKIKHICLERIRQIEENINPYPIKIVETVFPLEKMLDDYDLTYEDKIMLDRALIPNEKDRIMDYKEIIMNCDKRIYELKQEKKKEKKGFFARLFKRK